MTFSSSERRQHHGTGKRAVVLFLLIALIGALVWINREALLREAAQQWVVSDDLRPADAVIVLGGGLDTRPFAAAEDYRKGLAHKILVANTYVSNAEALGVLRSHTTINLDVLIKLGVPATDIETFGGNLANTYEEANALREWAIRTHTRNLIVPTEIFSSRRVHWMLTRALADTGIVVQIHALDYPRYNYANWWKTEDGVIAFQNEVIKYVYYRFEY
jgi:uncharacterized SAM-binding protein YcdF (DUF218 family)